MTEIHKPQAEFDQPAVLTREALEAAKEKVRNAPMQVCGVTEPHVVHPKARGWTNCADCFGPVFICGPHEPDHVNPHLWDAETCPPWTEGSRGDDRG